MKTFLAPPARSRGFGRGGPGRLWAPTSHPQLILMRTISGCSRGGVPDNHNYHVILSGQSSVCRHACWTPAPCSPLWAVLCMRPSACWTHAPCSPIWAVLCMRPYACWTHAPCSPIWAVLCMRPRACWTHAPCSPLWAVLRARPRAYRGPSPPGMGPRRPRPRRPRASGAPRIPPGTLGRARSPPGRGRGCPASGCIGARPPPTAQSTGTSPPPPAGESAAPPSPPTWHRPP
mmetsp:Transcript_39697/g.126843  ORF Transcript_39697/g.126843 Transcript_39697/m.126843 type:complete len:232 (-) Transcript_39697:96-791(-)